MDIGYVFDEYPKPLAIIKPIFKDGKCYDFTYIYVNRALGIYLGVSSRELIGSNFLKHFVNGEDTWFNGFGNTVKYKKSVTIEANDAVQGRKIKIETFPVADDLCGFFIHEVMNNDINSIEKITEMATKDFLTGAYNRFYLKQFELSATKINIGITLFDINNLKRINDTKGHLKGDEAIVDLVKKINNYYPTSNVFRMGGDEFLVITTDINCSDFLNLSIEFKNILNDSAAMGYKHFSEVNNYDDAISIVDSYMYADKRRTKLHQK